MINIQIKNILSCIFFITSIYSIRAQTNLNASGGDVDNELGTINYSVGQFFYNLRCDEQITVNPSIQIPYEFNVATSIIDDLQENISMSVFPNPTSGSISLSMEPNSLKGLTYNVTNIYGVTLIQGEIGALETTLNLSNLDSGAYIIKISVGVSELKNIKIIKH